MRIGKKSNNKVKLSLQQRENIVGYIFILPFIIGFALFVFAPVIQSILFSINDIKIFPGGFDLEYIGLENYNFALTVHVDFLRELFNSTLSMINNSFWILVFSFFAANILNQKFKGRLLARVIFFLPVIVSAGIVLRMQQTNYLMGVMQDAAEQGSQILEGNIGTSFLSGQILQDVLMQLRIPEAFLENISRAVDNIPQIINSSGIQILIFLTGLQSIPASLYEAAEVEGATKWENFWLITLPLLSPLILTNIVYTVVDYFISPNNTIVQLIRQTTFQGAGFGVSSAMSWIYFGTIIVIMAIMVPVISRFVFYQE